MHVKNIFFVLSVTFNVLFLLLLIFTLTRKITSFSVFNINASNYVRYIHSAFIVSTPALGAEISFGTAEFHLRVGAAASLQISAIRDGSQTNLGMEPLYDRSIVAVEQTGFGLLIAGLSPGETVLQLFSPDGFRNIAHIFVYE